MATITVRELARESKKVFEALEANKTPIVVTRNGRPFAALMPLDQDQADFLLLASNPEIAEMQRKAERVVASGGAKSLSDALAMSEQAGVEAQSTPDGDDQSGLITEVDAVIQSTSDVSESIAKTTDYITEKAINCVFRAGVDSPPDDKWAERIRELNSTLVEVSYLNELKRVASRTELASGLGRKVTRRKKNEKSSIPRELSALESARKMVSELNSELLLNARRAAPGDIEETFESELRGGVLFAKVAGFSSIEVSQKDEGRHGRGLLRHR